MFVAREHDQFQDVNFVRYADIDMESGAVIGFQAQFSGRGHELSQHRDGLRHRQGRGNHFHGSTTRRLI